MTDVDVPPVKVAIIGGGISGVSVAAYLAQKGVKNVFLVEGKTELGRGETAASAAMIMFNTNIGNPDLVKLAASAMREYAQLKKSLGIDPEIQRCGSIFVSTTIEGASRMEEQILLQNNYGIPTRLLLQGEILDMVPLLEGKDIKAGIYCPIDGYVNQMTLVEKLGNYARARGVNLWLDTTVTGITREPTGIVNVHTDSRGLIPAERIVIAAGAQSPELSTLFNRHLPLIYSTRTLYDVITDYNLTTPIIEFFDGPDEGYYLRPAEGKRCIVGVGPTQDSNQYPPEPINPFNKNETLEFMQRRFPRLGARDLTGIVGTRTMTADGLPYLGPIDSEGLAVAAYGLSGYGITFSLALTRNLADFIVEGKINREIRACLPTIERFNRSSGIETE